LRRIIQRKLDEPSGVLSSTIDSADSRGPYNCRQFKCASIRSNRTEAF